MNYGKRLRQARQHAKLTQAGLAAAINGACTQANISKLERTNATGSEFTIIFARACGVSPMWLATGNGSMIASEEGNADPAPALGEFRNVPVVGTAQLGDNGYWAALEFAAGQGDGFVPFPARHPGSYALRCKGDSMKPRIRSGEFVIVEPVEPTSGDEALIRAQDGRVMVKTFLYERDGLVHLLSINEAHPPQSIERKEILLFHTVIAIAKKALWRDF